MGWAEVWAGSPQCHPPGSGGVGGTSKGSSWGITKGNGDLGPPVPTMAWLCLHPAAMRCQEGVPPASLGTP